MESASDEGSPGRFQMRPTAPTSQQAPPDMSIDSLAIQLSSMTGMSVSASGAAHETSGHGHADEHDDAAPMAAAGAADHRRRSTQQIHDKNLLQQAIAMSDGDGGDADEQDAVSPTGSPTKVGEEKKGKRKAAGQGISRAGDGDGRSFL